MRPTLHSSALVLMLCLTNALGVAQSPPDEAIMFNKVNFFLGTPERSYEDPHLHFRYTGIPDHLITEIASTHEAEITYNPLSRCYEFPNITEPLWYYASYRVLLKYTDAGEYRVWATYDVDRGPDSTSVELANSMIMHPIAKDWINLYQGIVDRALKSSLAD